jgi:hypothetical protein
MKTNLSAPLFVALLFSGAAMDQQPQASIYVGIYGGSVTGSNRGTLSHNDPTTPGVTADTMFGAGVNQSFSPTGAHRRPGARL